ncbi:MAG: c-type cytochrome [Saprospiraceae bacterium]
MKQLKFILFIIVATILLNACSPAGTNRTGHEYMPDMAHSIAYEANVYHNYWLNTWDSTSVYSRRALTAPGLPVRGTVPRGYAAFMGADAFDFERIQETLRGGANYRSIAVPINGYAPYHYQDTEEERVRASNEIINNPFPITEAGLARGKALYDINCGVCHGEKGNGLGYLYDTDTNPNAKYPAAPANFLQDTFYNSTNGRFYHAIMYGKNVMGGYADKLSFEERWQVIHYIRALQATELKKTYTAEANDFNPAFGMPEKQFKQLAANRAGVSTVPGQTQPVPPQNQGNVDDVQSDPDPEHND